MKTKKDLIEDIRVLHHDVYDKKSDIEDLEEKIKELGMEKQNLINESKGKSEILNLIVDILAGKASPTSKTEVLIDMLPEVTEKIERRKPTSNPSYNYGRPGRF